MLTISHHRLQGEVVKLKKPYAVLEKKHNEFTTGQNTRWWQSSRPSISSRAGPSH